MPPPPLSPEISSSMAPSESPSRQSAGTPRRRSLSRASPGSSATAEPAHAQSVGLRAGVHIPDLGRTTSGGSRPAPRAVSARRLVARFVAAVLAATVLIAAGAFVVVSRAATGEAIRIAEEVTRVDAHAVIEPALTDGLVAGDAAAVAAMDTAVRNRVLTDRVLRVKIWSAGGRIVYSDEGRLVGDTYQLGDDELAALRTGNVASDVTDLSRPENLFEKRDRQLLEVYLPVHTASGRALLFETYQPLATIGDDERRVFMSFLPVILGGLLLLLAIQVPLALRLARRLEQARRERETLLQHAIDASLAERGRIARDLHDSVVQDIVGTSYRLTAESTRLRRRPAEAGGGEPETVHVLDSAAADMRRATRGLRTLIVEIAPPNLHDVEGLVSAVVALLAPLGERGVVTDIEAGSGLRIGEETATLLFRVAQEGLRNVARHAAAHHVAVRIEAAGARVAITVEDDGVGFSAADRLRRARRGHVGLDLLRSLVEDAGGVLAVTSAPGAGTRLRAEVPLP